MSMQYGNINTCFIFFNQDKEDNFFKGKCRSNISTAQETTVNNPASACSIIYNRTKIKISKHIEIYTNPQLQTELNNKAGDNMVSRHAEKKIAQQMFISENKR